MLSHLPTILAQSAPGGGMGINILFFGGIFAIMYFLLIKPQQKQAKEQQELMSALKKGDDVVTSGGLLGKVFAVTDKVVTLEVASGVKMRVLKSSIQGKVNVTDEKSETAEPKKEEK
jgi:preprotein translocase subunit YajC